MPPLARLVTLALLPAVAGCIPPSVHVFPLEEGGAPPAAATGAPIRIYLEEPPRCPYRRLARLTVEPYEEGQALWTEGVASRLRTRARALGADAIVGLRQGIEESGPVLVHSGQRERTSDSTTSRAVVAETTSVVQARREWLEGYAVRFTDAGCRE